MSLSTYLQQALLDHYLGIAPFTQPAALYAAAFTDDPGEDGSNESGMDRVLLSFSTPASAGSPSVANPDNAVVFTNDTGSTVTVTHIGIFDATTSGNFLVGGALPSSKQVPDGSQLSIDAADFNVTMD